MPLAEVVITAHADSFQSQPDFAKNQPYKAGLLKVPMPKR
jgi:hypothetical protein